MTREEIETKLKETVVSALDLEDLTPADIETDVPLFGEGLGLDSIDAMELGMAVKKAFGVSFSSNPADNKQIFRSVKTLADYVEPQQKASDMTDADSEKTTKDILVAEFACDPAALRPEVNLFTDLDLDSIDAVDLCMRLQQETKKKVTPEDFRQIRTLADVTKAVSKLVNES